uniref:Uncharacterized protein n=1 Tax=Knipowitschia caucasica TaxID=637954 RepID=A0AAV2IYS7_KNICA
MEQIPCAYALDPGSWAHAAEYVIQEARHGQNSASSVGPPSISHSPRPGVTPAHEGQLCAGGPSPHSLDWRMPGGGWGGKTEDDI